MAVPRLRSFRTALRAAPLMLRGLRASHYAAGRGGPGLEFARFGRRAGLSMLAMDRAAALELLLAPVSIVRYWEFPFVLTNLPDPPGPCLDVASPRLFSCYVASHHRPESIRILNPDRSDAEATARIAGRLGLDRISVDAVPVEAISGSSATYRSIWSISVLEHIAGVGDVGAMRLLWNALLPGGRLLVTVPVDRRSWDEYRAHDVYDLGVPRDERGFFFQRWYDEQSLRSRLLDGLSGAIVNVSWFGERTAGRFAAYERDWIERGYARTVDDPREIVDHYAEFPSWASMPGQGVAGLMIEKPTL